MVGSYDCANSRKLISAGLLTIGEGSGIGQARDVVCLTGYH